MGSAGFWVSVGSKSLRSNQEEPPNTTNFSSAAFPLKTAASSVRARRPQGSFSKNPQTLILRNHPDLPCTLTRDSNIPLIKEIYLKSC